MERNPIVTVDNVSMKFNLSSEKFDSFKEYVIKSIKRQVSYDAFMALQGVSFEVMRGDSVGLVGLNGSGKSTMLKVIAGVLKTDGGESCGQWDDRASDRAWRGIRYGSDSPGKCIFERRAAWI